jgi:ribosomal protein S18 acetylase RimI-like enzyme
MGWFDNQAQLTLWAGPNFRYPYCETTFTEDLDLDNLKTLALLNQAGKLVAVGQYSLRLDKCHLGRLVVNPAYRGQGIVARLIAKLSAQGLATLGVDACALFVFEHNGGAIKAYKSLGFVTQNFPQALPIEECLYMVKIAPSHPG